MRVLLRTLWKDTVVLRWWLLAWVAIVGGFAVWRDHTAAAWDAAPVADKPALAGTLMAAVLGCAAVLAVRVMHTDALHSTLAFWRTRPVSGLRLGVAKLAFALLWLIALPVGVECLLIEHWGWNEWFWPCIADWTISLAVVVVPALVAGALIPAPVLAVPVALGLAWLNYQSRPDAVLSEWGQEFSSNLSPAFWTFYARCLLGAVVALLASAGKQTAAVILTVLSLFSFPRMRSVQLPDALDPSAPGVWHDAPAPVIESDLNGQQVYVKMPAPAAPAWIGTSGMPALMVASDGATLDRLGERVQFPTRENRSPFFQTERDQFEGLFLGRTERWGFLHQIGAIPHEAKATGVLHRTLHYGTLAEPITGELPLRPGAVWQRGPCRIELVHALFPTDPRHGVIFQLRFSMPHFGTGGWQPSLHGTGRCTGLRYGLLNRRLGVVQSFQGGRGGAPSQEIYGLSFPPAPSGDVAHSQPLHRKDWLEWLYLPKTASRFDVPGYFSRDGELMRDAVIAFVEWRVIKHGEVEVTYDPWPPPPSAQWSKDLPPNWKERLAALTPPPLPDEAAMRRYVDELITLRGVLGSQPDKRYGSRSVPHFDRFKLLGSRWFPLIMRRLIMMNPYYGFGDQQDGQTDERSQLMDMLAAEMAEPEHAPLLLDLMAHGLPLPWTFKTHAWFRTVAAPRLTQVSSQFNLGSHWVEEMIALHDPALHPAIVAWFTRGWAADKRYIARKLMAEPGFPWRDVMNILRAKRWDMTWPERLSLTLLAAAGGYEDAPAEIAALITNWQSREKFDAQHYGDWLAVFAPVCPQCPAERAAALSWIVENAARLRWQDGQWILSAN